MNSSTITTTVSPDETGKAQQLIELGLAMDPEARSEILARLIAGSIHGGPETALCHFAGTGELRAEEALAELNQLRLPFEKEEWVDALGRYVLARGARS
ncbi:hypothetical protein [Paramicrobacterium agarici]|uniref:hypothetical protein n=1 Tax=Paramicrobacterium agarici TaxID=630514 RepID=UPI001154C9E2|nr:hypothetical protein [Microbacterium agarici]TQO21479.1 hypothetical protein FB385_0282 [Microbacterium agarici]